MVLKKYHKPRKHIAILGIRGIPAQHGGFETFAERLSLYLSERGWEVTVYCQKDGRGHAYDDTWKGIHLINIPAYYYGAIGTIIFDWKSALHAVKRSCLILTLGYNTAVFSTLYRLKRIPNIINMDGIEWKRAKWSFPARAWLYVNERIGCWLSNHLIADHPEIRRHLATRVPESKITMIPYGADCVEDADASLLGEYGLTPYQYALIIARPEPENSVLDIVSAFSVRKRGYRLVVLGKYEENDYQKKVLASATDEVLFLGAIYDKEIVNAMRFYARLYIHGHKVGGTNPSLVEALGAGSPVLAHDNCFNRWVAGKGAHYFENAEECSLKLEVLLDNNSELKKMKEFSLKRYREEFIWGNILSRYELLLKKWEMR